MDSERGWFYRQNCELVFSNNILKKQYQLKILKKIFLIFLILVFFDVFLYSYILLKKLINQKFLSFEKYKCQIEKVETKM